MVILKMSKPVSGEFECEVLGHPEMKDKLGLVRPCERYKELYNSCSSIKSRLYQLYIYGETIDCNQHYENYQTCLNYRKTKDLRILDKIIEWERNLIQIRLNTVAQNKAWELRTDPPHDFEAPLPEFIEKNKAKYTFFTRDNEK